MKLGEDDANFVLFRPLLVFFFPDYKFVCSFCESSFFVVAQNESDKKIRIDFGSKLCVLSKIKNRTFRDTIDESIRESVTNSTDRGRLKEYRSHHVNCTGFSDLIEQVRY